MFILFTCECARPKLVVALKGSGMTAWDQLRAWGANMFGLGMSEEAAAVIPHPAAELGLHITTKTAEAGALVGGGVLGPLVAFLKVPCLALPSSRVGRGPFVT